MGRTKGWSGELSAFGEYLKRHNVQRDAVAAGGGVTPSYISMLAHGKAKPGFRLARAIELWTRENVTESSGEALDLAAEVASNVAPTPAPFTCSDWEN